MPTQEPDRSWERRARENASHAEEEVHWLIRYINDEVVPEIRRNGSLALKAAADELHRLAERMDQVNREPPSDSPPK